MEVFFVIMAVLVSLGWIGGSVAKRYIASREQIAMRHRVLDVAADLDERVARLESRLADLAGEQKQLREEVDWQGKLLQRPEARPDDHSRG